MKPQTEIKLVGWSLILVLTVLSAVFAVIPEIIMYILWSIVHPTSEIVRLAMIFLFVFGGGSACVLFCLLAFMFWVTTVNSAIREFNL